MIISRIEIDGKWYKVEVRQGVDSGGMFLTPDEPSSPKPGDFKVGDRVHYVSPEMREGAYRVIMDRKEERLLSEDTYRTWSVGNRESWVKVDEGS